MGVKLTCCRLGQISLAGRHLTTTRLDATIRILCSPCHNLTGQPMPFELIDLPTPTYPSYRVVGVGRFGQRILQELAKAIPANPDFIISLEESTSARFEAATLHILLADPEDEGVDLSRAVEQAQDAGARRLIAVIPMPSQASGKSMNHAHEVLRAWQSLSIGLFLVPATESISPDSQIVDALRSLHMLTSEPSMPCIDFADVLTVLLQPGWGRIMIEEASGINRAQLAARAVVEHPELPVWLGGYGGALIVMTVNMAYADWSLDEYYAIMNVIQEKVHKDITLIIGINTDSTLGDRLRVTLYASGLPENTP